MKKIFLSTSLLLVAVLLTNAQQKKKKTGVQQESAPQQETVKLSYREIGSIMPPLRVVDTGGNVYTEADFRNNNHFFMFLFNPTCGHCQQMAKLVNDHASLFQKNKVLFMAGPAVLDYMNSFYQVSSIGKHPEFKVGVDSAAAVDRLYNYQSLPQINIYDKHRRLVKIFYGDVPLDSLKQYIP